jgi:hypothetical protein
MLLFRLFTLCRDHVSALMITLSESSCKESEMGELSDFEKRTDNSCAFSWSICGKTATLLGVSRATVSKVMSAAYTNHGKTTTEKGNSERKSTLTEIDRRTLGRIVS